MIQRRGFIFAVTSFLLTFKSSFNAKASSPKSQKGQIFKLEIDDKFKGKLIELKNGMVIELPANPECIDSLYRFSTTKSRWGKSPIIELNNQPFNGEMKPQIIVKKDLAITHSPYFNLQYVGPEIGWVAFLSS